MGLAMAPARGKVKEALGRLGALGINSSAHTHTRAHTHTHSPAHTRAHSRVVEAGGFDDEVVGLMEKECASWPSISRIRGKGKREGKGIGRR